MDRGHGQRGIEVMPAGIDEQGKKNRAFFFEALHTIQKQVDLTPAEADVVTQAAIRAIRTAKVKQ